LGTIRTGTNLQISYFDQYRAALDETKTVMDNVSEGRDTVTVGGKDKHILSYLQDFLFTPERARSPVTVLSGGERNRLLLAKLFTRPSNLLVLDEPTNDLDIETLELLEEVVSEYTGTLIIVSHDRTFINNTVTQCLVLKGDNFVQEFVGDYDDWLRFDENQKRSVDVKSSKTDPKADPLKSRQDRQRKMSHREQKELEAMPSQLEQLESEHAKLLSAMSSPDFYRKSPTDIKQAQTNVQILEEKIRKTYERWEELETMVTSSES
jgi:ATP-binding cassette subfamily F protein uup